MFARNQHRCAMTSQSMGVNPELSPYFAALGLPPSATKEEVRTAYKALVKRTHPDVPGGGADAFRRIVEAFEVLTRGTKILSTSRTAFDAYIAQRARAMRREFMATGAAERCSACGGFGVTTEGIYSRKCGACGGRGWA